MSRVFFSLLFFFLLSMPSFSSAAPSKKNPQADQLLLQGPFHIYTLGVRLWMGMLQHELASKRQTPSARLRIKKNIDNLERVLLLANKRYLSLMEERLPSKASPWIVPLQKRHEKIIEILAEIKEIILQGEPPSQEQKKRLFTLASPLAFPNKNAPSLEPKQRELLAEAIEIFATSNEIFGYYHVKQLSSCPSLVSSQRTAIQQAFLQQRRYLKTLQKKTGIASLKLFWYHSALLTRAAYLSFAFCHEKAPNQRAIFQKKRELYLQKAHKSLQQQTKSFSMLWVL